MTISLLITEEIESEELTERNATTIAEFQSLPFHDLVHADVYHSSTPELSVWLRTAKLDEFRHQIATTIAEIESQHMAHKAGIGALGLKDETWVRKSSAVKARYQCRMVEVKELVRKRNIEDQEQRHVEEVLIGAIRAHMDATMAEFEEGSVHDGLLWSHIEDTRA